MRLSPAALEVKQALVGVIRAGERWKTEDKVDHVVLYGWAGKKVVRWSIDRLLLRTVPGRVKQEVADAARFLRQETSAPSTT